ncbi:MAG: diguanylate cyclase [Fibrobacterales bacterium]
MKPKDTNLKKKHIDFFAKMAIEAFEGMFGVNFRKKGAVEQKETIEIQFPMICTVDSVGSMVLSFFISFEERTALGLLGLSGDSFESISINDKKRVIGMITEMGNVVIGSTQGSLEKEYGTLTLGLPTYWRVQSPEDYSLPAISNYSQALHSKIGDVQITLAYDFRELQIATQNRRLTEEATVDELTGLLNVRQYNYDIKMFIEKGNDGFGFSLLILDVDNFKQLNDTHGHKYGDKILTMVGNTVQNSIRSNDKCYRFGGDEFIVLLSGAQPEHVAMTARRICKNYQHHINKMNTSSLSIGGSTFEMEMTAEELFKRADDAMYVAKTTEGNTFEAYET